MNDYIDLAPSPISLIEALRNIGYSIETAVADIIDNSITAGASQINIRFSWNSGDPWLAIIDNGSGMEKVELINAMRFGSMNPLEIRDEKDLGRFGLGMKTASLSQCRHLTVLSKRNGQTTCCDWDLEKLSQPENKGWNLHVVDYATIEPDKMVGLLFKETLLNYDSGTIVFWEEIDRIKEQGHALSQENIFNELIDNTRKHLELVFHRFLSPDPGKKRVSIIMNGYELPAFNPFNPKNLATQELSEQKIYLNGEIITVQPYILPHHNKVSQEEYKQYSGEGGYLQNQGFYVYRNRRLIIKGTWFRLIKKEELNKLIRVKVDIPNSLDYLWKIDVKKSTAIPPEIIKYELRQVINKIEISGRKVYRQKGQKLSTGINDPVWNRIVSDGMISYQINRDHFLVKKLLNIVPSQQKTLVEDLITMFETSFPIDMFFNDYANHPESLNAPKFSLENLDELLNLYIDSGVFSGICNLEFQKKILSTDPFASNKDITKIILKQRGYEIE